MVTTSEGLVCLAKSTVTSSSSSVAALNGARRVIQTRCVPRWQNSERLSLSSMLNTPCRLSAAAISAMAAWSCRSVGILSQRALSWLSIQQNACSLSVVPTGR
jgi:hypothetical protein